MLPSLRLRGDEIVAAHGRYIAAVQDLVQEVADGLQLILDPDLDTFHMMELSILRGPMQQENTAPRLGLGVTNLKSHEFGPAWTHG